MIRAAAILMALTLFASPAGAAEDPRKVTGGLEFPTGIEVLDDGRLIVNERAGRVRIVEGRTLLPEPLAVIPTTTAGETGLLDVAAPADTAADPAVYVFATEADGASNSVWRVPLDGSGPTRVVTGLPAAIYHNGGGVDFGSDGKLYVSNGEQHDTGRSQDPQALGGKVYRYNPDGTIPDDNPFPGSPTYALGLRNPFGLTVDPLSDAVWVTENGPSSFDEINRVVAKGNYGWPDVSGPGCGDPCTDPVLAYESIIVPTGIAIADRSAPPAVRGDLFFGSYGEANIHRIELDGQRREAVGDEILLRAPGPVVALEWGPKGLYYSTTSAVFLVAFESGQEKDDEQTPEPTEEPRAEPSASPTEGAGATSDDAQRPPWAILILVALGASFLMLRARVGQRSEEDARRDPTDV